MMPLGAALADSVGETAGDEDALADGLGLAVALGVSCAVGVALGDVAEHAATRTRIET
jgi:hypothetical protein